MKYIGGQEECMDLGDFKPNFLRLFDIVLISSTADKGQYAVDWIVHTFHCCAREAEWLNGVIAALLLSASNQHFSKEAGRDQS